MDDLPKPPDPHDRMTPEQTIGWMDRLLDAVEADPTNLVLRPDEVAWLRAGRNEYAASMEDVRLARAAAEQAHAHVREAMALAEGALRHAAPRMPGGAPPAR